jgi:hypothetical protein
MLPRMTWGNWFFWGIMAFIGVIFFWLGLLGKYVPLWVGAIVALAAFLALLVFGPRIDDQEED